jgi:hypothetical protein
MDSRWMSRERASQNLAASSTYRQWDHEQISRYAPLFRPDLLKGHHNP